MLGLGAISECYVSNHDLTVMTGDLQASGQMPDELVTALTRIMAGVVRRYQADDGDDLIQEFILLVLTKYQKVDLTRNVFAYYTTSAINLVRQRRRRRSPQSVELEGEYRSVASVRRDKPEAARPALYSKRPEDRRFADFDRRYGEVVPLIAGWRGQGKSWRVIADLLHDAGYRTSNGHPWTATNARAVATRMKAGTSAADWRAAQRERRFAPVIPLIERFRAEGASWDTVAKLLNEAGHVSYRGHSWTGKRALYAADQMGILPKRQPVREATVALVSQWRQQGVIWREIADRLNLAGHLTQRGKQWKWHTARTVLSGAQQQSATVAAAR